MNTTTIGDWFRDNLSPILKRWQPMPDVSWPAAVAAQILEEGVGETLAPALAWWVVGRGPEIQQRWKNDEAAKVGKVEFGEYLAQKAVDFAAVAHEQLDRVLAAVEADDDEQRREQARAAYDWYRNGAKGVSDHLIKRAMSDRDGQCAATFERGEGGQVVVVIWRGGVGHHFTFGEILALAEQRDGAPASSAEAGLLGAGASPGRSRATARLLHALAELLEVE